MKRYKQTLKTKSSICFTLVLWIGIYTLQAQEIQTKKDTFKVLTKQYSATKIYPKGTGTSYFIFEDKLRIKSGASRINFSEAPSSIQYINPVLANQQPVPFFKKQPLKAKRKTIEK
ncbi:hypothetical protein ABW636_16770 [Aquimarina sp. 2201CG1-2-11]|uniref:hypothetical protein n=1 Tax=Aquimarina discodermiae TaxID=3231043 RepID=UPI003463633F